jgi:hypothetical protein
MVGTCYNNLPAVINSKHLTKVNVAKDLDVHADDHIKFNTLVLSLSRVHFRANPVLKCSYSKDTKVIARAFEVYVRSVVEYACCVWSLHLMKGHKVNRINACRNGLRSASRITSPKLC